MAAPNSEFVLEHYRALRERFTSQGNRLWMRFHFFLTVEVALGAYLLRPPAAADGRVLPSLLGVLMSLLWFLIGAQDYWFYEDSRKRLSRYKSECILAKIDCWGEEQENTKFRARSYQKTICFLIPGVGVTAFAAICPLICLTAWAVAACLG